MMILMVPSLNDGSFERRCDFYSLGRNNPINILTSCGAKDLEDNGNDSNIQNETDNNSISRGKIICE